MKNKATEICAECGKSVAWGSNHFINRVPECNDRATRRKMGRPFPKGDYVCADCDNITSDELGGS